MLYLLEKFYDTPVHFLFWRTMQVVTRKVYFLSSPSRSIHRHNRVFNQYMYKMDQKSGAESSCKSAPLAYGKMQSHAVCNLYHRDAVSVQSSRDINADVSQDTVQHAEFITPARVTDVTVSSLSPSLYELANAHTVGSEAKDEHATRTS
jgi:hypothetical protein